MCLPNSSLHICLYEIGVTYVSAILNNCVVPTKDEMEQFINEMLAEIIHFVKTKLLLVKLGLDRMLEIQQP